MTSIIYVILILIYRQLLCRFPKYFKYLVQAEDQKSSQVTRKFLPLSMFRQKKRVFDLLELDSDVWETICGCWELIFSPL